jgi:hypothetical protein
VSTAALLRMAALAAALVGILVASAPAIASHDAFDVDTELDFADITPGDGICLGDPGNQTPPGCSLRAAVMEANAHDGVDTINVPAGLYVLTESGNDEDSGATGDLDVTSIITIVGAGSGDDPAVDTIIDGFREEIGASADRVLDVQSQGILDITDVRIQNGQWTGNGGAVRNFGDLTMTDSIVLSSIAGEDGGGFYNHRNGVLTLRDVTVEDNTAGWGGGLYNNSDGDEPEGDEDDPPGLLIEDSTISSNEALEVGEQAYGGYGGGLFNDDEAMIVRTTFEDNTAEYGGAIYNDVDDNLDRLNQPAELSITDSLLTRNVADEEGGGIYNDGMLTIDRSSVSVNGADDDGGGIYNGGAEAPLRPPATAVIVDSTVSGNAADGGDGGGIYNEELLTLLRSTVSGNGVAELADETFETENGAGIFNADGDTFIVPPETLSRATIEIVNSTISGNTALAHGGGIYNQGVALLQPALLQVGPVPTVILNHSTITGNTANAGLNSDFSADFWGGGIFNEPVPAEIEFEPGEILTMNTIVAGNAADEGEVLELNALVASNCAGEEPVSDGHNLENADTCGFDGAGDLANTDPKLGALADNGGPTLTHALLEGSPAIDKAAGGTSCPATDQRGTTRPQGPGCDIGAYERLFQAPQPQPQPQPQPAPQPPATTPPPPPATTPRPRAPRAVRRCVVPNVRGKTVRQARRAIARAGCRAVVMGRRYSTTTAPGRVLGQSIRAGRRVRRGTIVRLLIARRIQPVRPPFTG